MIQVKHTLSFPKTFDLSTLEKDPKLVELGKIQALCREEASNRGCIYFKEVDVNNKSMSVHFIWFEKTDADNFVAWANETHNYTEVYNDFVKRIQELGGTVSRDETVLEE